MMCFKHCLSIIGISLVLTMSAQADTITPIEASEHIGSLMTVEGVVSQVSISGGGTTFINFGGQYPDHVFYGVIFRNRSDEFPNAVALEGRAIEVSGTIELYKGKPQIILTSSDQIELAD